MLIRIFILIIFVVSECFSQLEEIWKNEGSTMIVENLYETEKGIVFFDYPSRKIFYLDLLRKSLVKINPIDSSDSTDYGWKIGSIGDGYYENNFYYGYSLKKSEGFGSEVKTKPKIKKINLDSMKIEELIGDSVSGNERFLKGFSALVDGNNKKERGVVAIFSFSYYDKLIFIQGKTKSPFLIERVVYNLRKTFIKDDLWIFGYIKATFFEDYGAIAIFRMSGDTLRLVYEFKEEIINFYSSFDIDIVDDMIVGVFVKKDKKGIKIVKIDLNSFSVIEEKEKYFNFSTIPSYDIRVKLLCNKPYVYIGINIGNETNIYISDLDFSDLNLEAPNFKIVTMAEEYNVPMKKMKDGYVYFFAQGIYRFKAPVTNVKAEEIPTKFMLHQNYPNPFNSMTTIEFEIPEKVNVKLKVYNIVGREIETLVDKELEPGKYKFNFNANNLPSGIYLYTLKTPKFVKTKKMILIK